MPDFRVLFCASEVTPFAKTGGLADVAGALPAALRQLGCDARVFMPLYRTVRQKAESLTRLGKAGEISVGIHDYRVHLWETDTSSGVPVYFLEKEEFYDRTYLYGTPGGGDYDDNAERYITFCQAIYSLCVELNWYPDIFHLHDWQAALTSGYHHFHWRHDPKLAHSGTVFTIHNLAYQGRFSGAYFSLTGLPAEAFSVRGMEFWGQCNFMKAGIAYSDFLTTVSPRYSREIQQPELGHGLDGLLQERRDDLAGILNGVDYSTWDPETDPMIPARYGAAHLDGKKRCKEALLSELGLPEESAEKPLLGMISRLASQKGFDLLLEIIEDLMVLPVSLVILGTGEANIEKRLEEIATLYPAQLRVLLKFDERLAHSIEAGADLFLMPSHYEPCGLNQMYSLRYGTIPVVYATGGLDDSVVDVLQHPYNGTGFKFYDYKPFHFLYVVRSAIELFQNRQGWVELQQRAMAQDFSWNRSARDYLEIYRKVLDRKQKARHLGRIV